MAIANRDFCGDSIVNDGEECDDGNILTMMVVVVFVKLRKDTIVPTLIGKPNHRLQQLLMVSVFASTCGDGILDHSIAFSTQQKYRRIPQVKLRKTLIIT